MGAVEQSVGGGAIAPKLPVEAMHYTFEGVWEEEEQKHAALLLSHGADAAKQSQQRRGAGRIYKTLKTKGGHC